MSLQELEWLASHNPSLMVAVPIKEIFISVIRPLFFCYHHHSASTLCLSNRNDQVSVFSDLRNPLLMHFLALPSAHTAPKDLAEANLLPTI
jgi:hypothetical protein